MCGCLHTYYFMQCQHFGLVRSFSQPQRCQCNNLNTHGILYIRPGPTCPSCVQEELSMTPVCIEKMKEAMIVS